MIDFVEKYTWTDRDGKTAWAYRVYYTAPHSFRRGLRRDYSHDKTLPVTVLDYILTAGHVITTYPRDAQLKNLKIELFRK